MAFAMMRRTKGSCGVISGLESLAAPNMVRSAIAQASAATGADFDYLLRTAARESSFDSAAKSRTSSASGLFQFIEQTWLGVVKRHGAEFGLGEAAAAITQDGHGRYQVSNSADRAEILALRHDPRVSALMAGALTEESRQSLETALGRDVSGAELYMAHFLGTGGAIKLIQANETAPGQSAAAMFPDAAQANRPIFYEASGRARSVAEVYANLSAKHSGEGPAAPVPRQSVPTHDFAMMTAPRDVGARMIGYRHGGGGTAYQPLTLSPAVLDILQALNDPIATAGKADPDGDRRLL